MEHTTGLEKFKQLISPSWLEGTIITSLIVLALSFIFLPGVYKGSDLELYFSVSGHDQTTIIGSAGEISNRINDSALAGDVAIFATWALIGAISYVLVGMLFRLIKTVVLYVGLEGYFKGGGDHPILHVLSRAVVRIVAVVGVFGVYKLVSLWVLPWVLSVSHSLFTAPGVQSVCIFVISIFVLAASLHAVTVLLRLAFLRMRVFMGQS